LVYSIFQIVIRINIAFSGSKLYKNRTEIIIARRSDLIDIRDWFYLLFQWDDHLLLYRRRISTQVREADIVVGNVHWRLRLFRYRKNTEYSVHSDEYGKHQYRYFIFLQEVDHNYNILFKYFFSWTNILQNFLFHYQIQIKDLFYYMSVYPILF